MPHLDLFSSSPSPALSGHGIPLLAVPLNPLHCPHRFPPQATAFNFSVMPQSDVPEGRKEGKTEFQKRLGRRLAMIKKGRKEA